MDIQEALNLAARELTAQSYGISSNPLNWIGPNAKMSPEAEHKACQLLLAAQTLREHLAELNEL